MYYVRKVQLEYCYESNCFAPSDDILTLQKYGIFFNFASVLDKKCTILSNTTFKMDKIDKKNNPLSSRTMDISYTN